MLAIVQCMCISGKAEQWWRSSSPCPSLDWFIFLTKVDWRGWSGCLCEEEALCTCGVLVAEDRLSSSSCRFWLLLSACSSCWWSCRNCSLGTNGQLCCWSSCRSQWEDGLSIAVDLRGCIWRTRARLGQYRAFCQRRCRAGDTELRAPSPPPSPWSLRNGTKPGGSAWIESFNCLLEIIHYVIRLFF